MKNELKDEPEGYSGEDPAGVYKKNQQVPHSHMMFLPFSYCFLKKVLE
jgi:hypothetical protein